MRKTITTLAILTLCLQVFGGTQLRQIPTTSQLWRTLLTNETTADIKAAIGIGSSLPLVTLSPKGIANGKASAPNNGFEFGPDTPGTTTLGLNEAVNSLYQTNGIGPISGGGRIFIDAGQFDCPGQIIIPYSYPFALFLEGAGMTSTMLRYTGTTNFFVGPTIGFPNTLQLVVRNMGFSYLQDTNKAWLFRLGGVNQAIFDNCLFTTYQTIASSVTDAIAVDYLPGAPTNKVGIGGIRLDGGSNNKITLFRCSFYGLACGAWIAGDHVSIIEPFFGNIGLYWPSGFAVAGTAYTSGGGADDNVLALGPCIVSDAGGFELNIINPQFSTDNVMLMGGPQGATSAIWIQNPLYEQLNYGTLISDDADGVDVVIDKVIGGTVSNRLVHLSTGVVGGPNMSTVTINRRSGADGSSQILTIERGGTNIFSLSPKGNLTVPGVTLTQPYTSLSTNIIHIEGAGTNSANGDYYFKGTTNPAALDPCGFAYWTNGNGLGYIIAYNADGIGCVGTNVPSTMFIGPPAIFSGIVAYESTAIGAAWVSDDPLWGLPPTLSYYGSKGPPLSITSRAGWTNELLSINGGIQLSTSNYTTAAITREMNAYSGKVKITSGQQTYTIRNAYATATCKAWAVVNTSTATSKACWATPTAGFLTLKLDAACSADCDVSWWIMP